MTHLCSKVRVKLIIVQEYIEEGEIHMVAPGLSTLADQVTLIPEQLAGLDSRTDEITSSSGIKIVDTTVLQRRQECCSV